MMCIKYINENDYNNIYNESITIFEKLAKKVFALLLTIMLSFQFAQYFVPDVTLLNYANHLENRILNQEAKKSIGYIEMKFSGYGDIEILKNGIGHIININGMNKILLDVKDGDILQIKRKNNFEYGIIQIIDYSDNIDLSNVNKTIFLDRNIKTICRIQIML